MSDQSGESDWSRYDDSSRDASMDVIDENVAFEEENKVEAMKMNGEKEVICAEQYEEWEEVNSEEKETEEDGGDARAEEEECNYCVTVCGAVLAVCALLFGYGLIVFHSNIYLQREVLDTSHERLLFIHQNCLLEDSLQLIVDSNCNAKWKESKGIIDKAVERVAVAVDAKEQAEHDNKNLNQFIFFGLVFLLLGSLLLALVLMKRLCETDANEQRMSDIEERMYCLNKKLTAVVENGGKEDESAKIQISWLTGLVRTRQEEIREKTEKIQELEGAFETLKKENNGIAKLFNQATVELETAVEYGNKTDESSKVEILRLSALLHTQQNELREKSDRIRELECTLENLQWAKDELYATAYDDDEMTVCIQNQLILLLHAHKCLRRKQTSSPSDSIPCFLPHCAMMQDVLSHMETCEQRDDCQYAHCASSRSILTHFRKCVNHNCLVCTPLKNPSAIVKSKADKDEVVEVTGETAKKLEESCDCGSGWCVENEDIHLPILRKKLHALRAYGEEQ